MIGVAIISRNREELAQQCVERVLAVKKYNDALGTMMGPVVLMSHKTPFNPLSFPDGVLLHHTNANGSLGMLRNYAIAYLLSQYACEYILVLDDDILLNQFEDHEFMRKLWNIFSVTEVFQPAMVGLSHKHHYSFDGTDRFIKEVKMLTTSGGVLVNVDDFQQVGGFGEDYFDIPELVLRMREAGKKVYKTYPKVSEHLYQKAGGLKDVYPDKKNCNEMRHLSNIVENFPDLVYKDEKAWLGFTCY